MAATDYVLKIKGIEGEAPEGGIEVQSYSIGVQNSASSHSGGSGAGKAAFKEMHFTMNVCTASPKLFLACAGGDHIPEAVLSVRKSGGGSHPETYVKWKFTDVVISKYDNLGSMGGLIPHDDFSITFAKVEFEYRPQKANGSLGGAIPAGWDLKQGTKV